jgi:hypothetical protein
VWRTQATQCGRSCCETCVEPTAASLVWSHAHVHHQDAHNERDHDDERHHPRRTTLTNGENTRTRRVELGCEFGVRRRSDSGTTVHVASALPLLRCYVAVRVRSRSVRQDTGQSHSSSPPWSLTSLCCCSPPQHVPRVSAPGPARVCPPSPSSRSAIGQRGDGHTSTGQHDTERHATRTTRTHVCAARVGATPAVVAVLCGASSIFSRDDHFSISSRCISTEHPATPTSITSS